MGGWWYVKGPRSTPDWCIIKTQEMSRVNKNNSDIYIYIYIPPPRRVEVCKGFDKIEINNVPGQHQTGVNLGHYFGFLLLCVVI